MQDVREPADDREHDSASRAFDRAACGRGGTGASRKRGPMASAHFVLSRRIPAQAGGVAVSGDGLLLMAVPKRLLKRAVDRNTLRRIAREAWRARPKGTRPETPVLLRLAKRPAGFDTLTQRARKRLWRAEIDALLAHDAACDHA